MEHNTDFVSAVIEALDHPFYVIDAETYQVKMANAAAHHGDLPAAITCYALTHRLNAPCDNFGALCPLTEIKKSLKPVVVEKILDLSRLEAQALPLARDWWSVTTLIDGAIHRWRSALSDQTSRLFWRNKGVKA